ncbi:pitrilysin family protein [Synechococcus sp. CBW1006]|uniref:M16 family metallopeptidase n=1 Tax=Synechococcus sp. CBW1006 TaxID=1353138 RepID=UPI0018CF108F|nr:pitrilysin family protein [Synechococcus sp. CBW1006]QPN66155.1 insulinase family protein [Synechococcus sp. CBW1006]
MPLATLSLFRTTPETMLLPGGLPLAVVHRPGPAILSARLWIRGGSSLDPAGACGAHQILAGLMTRGCGDLGPEALADLVEGCGAALRCEASEDNLLLSLKCAREDADLLLPLLLTMVQSPWLRADQFELERQLNLQALQRQKEDPFQLCHDRLRQQLYGNGPYGHDPLGLEADLQGLELEALDPLRQTLGAHGAVLVLCGDVPQSLITLLQRSLEASPWSSQAPLKGTGPLGWPGERLALCSQDTEQMVLMLGAATVPLGEQDGLALRLLHSHLGMGMSSRLFVVMREEQGLAYDVGVHLPARRGAAPFVFHLSTSADRAADACRSLLDEWQRLLEHPLDAEELELALAKFRGQDAMGRQTCGQIADRLALVLGHGLPTDYVDQALERAGQFDGAALQAAAQRCLRRPHLSLCGPTAALEGAAAVWTAHPLST